MQIRSLYRVIIEFKNLNNHYFFQNPVFILFFFKATKERKKEKHKRIDRMRSSFKLNRPKAEFKDFILFSYSTRSPLYWTILGQSCSTSQSSPIPELRNQRRNRQPSLGRYRPFSLIYYHKTPVGRRA